MTCPAPANVERAYWSNRNEETTGDEAIHAHVAECTTCAATWREIAALAQLGSHIVAPSLHGEEIRTTLLSRMERTPVRETRRSRLRLWWILAPIAATAVLVWVAWPAPDSTFATTARRGVVFEHSGAKQFALSTQPDEIVRVADGTVSVSVGQLGPGERFRRRFERRIRRHRAPRPSDRRSRDQRSSRDPRGGHEGVVAIERDLARGERGTGCDRRRRSDPRCAESGSGLRRNDA
jgi:hypothetical protein